MTLAAATSLLPLSVPACGGALALRPLFLEVEGLSARAERLTALLFSASRDVRCAGLSSLLVRELEPDTEASWSRSSGAVRRLELPHVETNALTAVVYSEDPEGTLLQLGCAEIEYADLESPEVVLTLADLP